MSKYAHLNADTIANIVEADQALATELGLTLIEGLNPEPGIGWSNATGQWQPPNPDPAIATGATLQQRADNALTSNAAYLNIAAPTNAQIAAQVATLTRQCNGIIRLLLGRLDTTAGT